MRLILSSLLVVSSLLHAAQPYNVLVIMVDDYGVDFTSQNTHPDAVIPSMPRMDTLASTGVRFTEFRTSAQCAQTRASFLTGRYPYLHTVDFVGVTLPAGEFTLADDLGDNHSYETAMFGKWNLGGGNPGAEQDYPRTLGGFDYFAGSYPVAGFQCLHYATPKTVNGGAPTTNAADRYVTTDEADDAIAWINGATEPWFVELCFHAPHFALAGAYRYPPTALQRNFIGTPGESGGVNAYLSSLEALDTEMGRVIDECDLNQTVILFFGDNGSPHINPPVPADRLKGSNYDNGVRSPLIIHWPGTVNPGRTSRHFCNTVDLYPTIVMLATGTTHASPNTLSGQDISGIMRGEVVPQRIQWDSDNQDTINPTITSDGRYRLYDYVSDPDEFYNIASDPYEQINLGTSGLTGPALNAYNNLRYALTTFTNKTSEQPVVEVNYSQPSIVTGGIQVVSGGVAVTAPAVGSSTITAPLKSGATNYILWVRDNPFGAWVDSGITESVGSVVTFVDPSPVGRKQYRITNNAPEP